MTEVIGLLAAFFTTVAYVPQTIKILKTKDTKSLSLGMYCLITTGLALWLIYGILIGDTPIIIANAITVVLSGTILVMKLRNG